VPVDACAALPAGACAAVTRGPVGRMHVLGSSYQPYLTNGFRAESSGVSDVDHSKPCCCPQPPIGLLGTHSDQPFAMVACWTCKLGTCVCWPRHSCLSSRSTFRPWRPFGSSCYATVRCIPSSVRFAGRVSNAPRAWNWKSEGQAKSSSNTTNHPSPRTVKPLVGLRNDKVGLVLA
jgi:hypothetical protein